jgi:hypothetical protein
LLLLAPGLSLAFICSEYYVLRATVLSIALIFAAGTTSALLWCQSMAAAAAECHEQELVSLKIVAGNHNCRTADVRIVALYREDVRRDVSARAGDSAFSSSQHQVAVSTAGTQLWHHPWRVRCLDNRPLQAVIRI